ncbi:MAG: hypothetical protein KAT32_03235 [Candidatus Moranbacteria bacterium]|nr:hypothetical protein [Candidatus Moranbacteria bacterium]
MKSVFSIFLIVVIFFPFFCRAEKIGIAIDKSFFSFNSKAGDEQIISLNIQNIFPEEQEVKIEISSYEIMGDDNEITFIPQENEKSIKGWFIIENKTFTLNAEEIRGFSAKIKIPEDAKSGSYQGILFFNITTKNQKYDSVNEIGRVGAHILINVIDSKKNGAGEISKFDVPLFVGDEIDMNFSYKNLGNIHYVPYGEIRISNFFKTKQEKKVVGKHFIFPEKEFNFEENREGFFWLGLYKVRVAFVDADGWEHDEVKYVLGYFFLPLIFFILIFLFFLIKFLRKRNSVNKKV